MMIMMNMFVTFGISPPNCSNVRYATILQASFTCAQKLTEASLIYRTEAKQKK